VHENGSNFLTKPEDSWIVLKPKPKKFKIGKIKLKSSHREPSNKFYNVKIETKSSHNKEELHNTNTNQLHELYLPNNHLFSYLLQTISIYKPISNLQTIWNIYLCNSHLFSYLPTSLNDKTYYFWKASYQGETGHELNWDS
jgi:hypothetical protein